MILKVWNVFSKRQTFKKIGFNFKMFCTLNVRLGSKRILFERKYVMYIPEKIFDRKIVCGCEIKSLNGLFSKKSCRNFSLDDESDYEHFDDLDGKFSSTTLRNLLYPNSEDPVIIKLKESTTVQELFDVVSENSSEFNAEKCAQAVLVLWDFQKQCRGSEIFEEIYLPGNDLLRTYLNQLKCHDMFETLLNILNKTYNDMSLDALACSLLYLTRMGVDYDSDVIKNLRYKVDNLLGSTRVGEFPLSALSRYILAVSGVNKNCMNLHGLLLLTNVLPHVDFWLRHCDTVNCYKLITVCVRSLKPVFTSSFLENYLNLTNHFIESNKLYENIEENVSLILKVITLLNFFNSNGVIKTQLHGMILKLMHHLVGSVDKMDHFKHFFDLQKVFSYLLEPAPLQIELKRCCSQWVENSQVDWVDMTDISPKLLFCLVTNASPSKQYRFSDSGLQVADKTTNLNDLYTLLSISLRPLLNLHKRIWPKLLCKLDESEYLRNMETLTFIAARYMDHFIQGRDIQFERQLMNWILFELHNTSAFYEPSKLSKSALFVLSFPEHFQYRDTNITLTSFIQQLLNNVHQFGIYDCVNVSRSFIPVLRNSDFSSQILHHYVKLDTALNQRTVELLEEIPMDKPSLHSLNLIFRSYINRRGATDSYILQKILERYRNVQPDEISSRDLRNTMYNFMSMNTLIPELMDRFYDYVVTNAENVVGSTLSKLLFSSFVLNHYPKNELFFSVASDIISRDVDQMSGLVLLQSAISLSSYGYLNDFLIKHIFTIEFLDQLDSEMKHGYSKSSYPARIRKWLMELNRSVCLDYPEARVPWFHAKFCEQEALSSNRVSALFNRDVYETLLSITRNRRLIQRNVMSSYGHVIDFQLCIDDDKNIVPCKKGIDQFTKLAVILYAGSDYTIGVRRLKGLLQLHQKHLEMLGYKMILVDENSWNSMYMTEPKAKFNYLSNLIKNNC